MEVKLHVEGLDRLQRKLNALGSSLEREIDVAVGQGAARMQDAVKMLTPTAIEGGGNLKNKIIIQHPQPCTYTVETNVEYAVFVEFGTGFLGDPVKPHTDKLSWVYFSEKYNDFRTAHPRPPAHMFTQGFADTYRTVIVIVDKKIKEIMEK